MELFYKIDGGNYTSILMNNIQDNNYSCEVTGLPTNAEIEYYFKAIASSGKVINRPIVALKEDINFHLN